MKNKYELRGILQSMINKLALKINCNLRTTHMFCGGDIVAAHRHSNGGGWVADTAIVADTAYVGPDAEVSGSAKVLDNAQILGYARVCDRATVSGNAVIYGKACVYQNATVIDRANVSGNAMIYGNAIVKENSSVCDSADVGSSAVIEGHSCIYGETTIKDYANICDNTVVKERATVGGIVVTNGSSYITEDCVNRSPMFLAGGVLPWEVTITDNHLRIGCQCLTFKEWEEITDERLCELTRDGKALEYREHLKLLLELARLQ